MRRAPRTALPAPRFGLRRAAAGLVVSALVGGLVLLGLSLDGGGKHPHGLPGPTTTTSGGAANPTTSTTVPGTVPNPVAIGTYRVTTTSLDAPVATAPGTIAVRVWYPSGPASANDLHTTPGHYPVVVFSQGFDQSPSSYLDLIDAWASAGFVVAAPHYPDTDPKATTPSGPTPSRTGISHHPADLAAALTAVLQSSGTAGNPLSGMVNPGEVGLAGQSDGANVTLAAGADTCCRLTTVKALVLLSGAEYSGFGGTYFTGPTPPLLVVQGNVDVVNPPGCSAQIYDGAPTPKYYLDLLGATHLPPYETASTPWEPVVAAVTTDFLEAELEGRSATLSVMAQAGNRTPAVAALSAGGSAPQGTPYCPPTAGGPPTAG